MNRSPLKEKAAEFLQIDNVPPLEEFKIPEPIQLPFWSTLPDSQPTGAALNLSAGESLPLNLNSGEEKKSRLLRKRKNRPDDMVFSLQAAASKSEYLSLYSNSANLLASVNSSWPVSSYSYYSHPPPTTVIRPTQSTCFFDPSSIESQWLSLFPRLLSPSSPAPTDLTSSFPLPIYSSVFNTSSYTYQTYPASPLAMYNQPLHLTTPLDGRELALGQHNLNILQQTASHTNNRFKHTQTLPQVIPQAKKNKKCQTLLSGSVAKHKIGIGQNPSILFHQSQKPAELSKKSLEYIHTDKSKP